MKQNLLLSITSVLSILLMTFHLADDIVHGFEGGAATLFALPVLAVWLYGALALADRRSGCVIMLLGSLLGMLVPVLHLTGTRIGEIASSSGGFFFLWTLIALGVTALISAILSLRGLWNLRRTTAN